MPQPRRPPSSADRQVAAKRTVRLAAVAMQESLDRRGVEIGLVTCEGVVTDLINGGLLAPVKRPEPEPPMAGQVTIDEITIDEITIDETISFWDCSTQGHVFVEGSDICLHCGVVWVDG